MAAANEALASGQEASCREKDENQAAPVRKTSKACISRGHEGRRAIEGAAMQAGEYSPKCPNRPSTVDESMDAQRPPETGDVSPEAPVAGRGARQYAAGASANTETS